MNKVLFCFMLLCGLICSCNKNTEASKETNTIPTENSKYPSQRTENGIGSVSPIVKENYAAKNPGWFVSLDEAYKESQKTGKPILANFTGSDWCGWCIKLDEAVFQKPKFSKWSKKQFVLLEVDFPMRFLLPLKLQMQNEMLKKEFNIKRYPTVFLFDLSKDQNNKWVFKKLTQTGYCKSLAEFENKMRYPFNIRG